MSAPVDHVVPTPFGIRKNLILIIVIFLVLLGTLFTLTGCSNSLDDPLAIPSITLEPQTGYSNTEVEVSGINFPAGTIVILRLGPPDVGATPFSYGKTTSNEDGRFLLKFKVPNGWPDNRPFTDPNLIVIAMNEEGSIKATAPFFLQLNDSETKIVTVESSPELIATYAPENEAAIVSAVLAYLTQSGEPTQVAIVVEYLEDEFARVSITPVSEVAGQMRFGFLKLVQSNWEVLILGQDLAPDQLLELGIPTSVIPEEWLIPEG